MLGLQCDLRVKNVRSIVGYMHGLYEAVYLI